MYPTALMAFLHHVAAFTLVAALAVEVALFKPPLSPGQAYRLLRTDMIFGISAGVLLVIGLLRVTYFEKGPAYYWHDVFFLIKFGAFLLAALISISIGLVNLFPIPILDGGHLLYYGFEAVLGRPLGAKAQDLGFRLGLAVMVCLMLLAAWNDLVRLNLF